MHDNDKQYVKATHLVFRCSVCPDIHFPGDDIELYLVWNGVGRSLPKSDNPESVRPDKLAQGDVVIAISKSDGTAGYKFLDLLQFWQVIAIEDDIITVDVCSIVGSGANSEQIYDAVISHIKELRQ